MFCSKDDKASTIIISLLIGGAVGAGLALILAPQSGRKTRQQIADLAEDIKDYTTDLSKKLASKLT